MILPLHDPFVLTAGLNSNTDIILCNNTSAMANSHLGPNILDLIEDYFNSTVFSPNYSQYYSSTIGP